MPIEVERHGGVETIAIRGYNAYNAITQDMYLDLHRVLLELDGDQDIRVAILRGYGDTHFSVGGDLRRHQEAAAPLTTAGHLSAFWYPDVSQPAAGLNRVTLFSRRTSTPVIAAINGYCLGGAFIAMCLHSSIRIAGQDAQFGFAETRLGLGGVSQSAHLSDQIPYTSLMWMVATGKFINAEHALRVGLVNEVVPDSEVMGRAQQISALVARNAPLTVRAEKEGIFHTERVGFRSAVEIAEIMEVLNALTPDALEGLTARRDGRPAAFQSLQSTARRKSDSTGDGAPVS
jgi:enoyl-CoA hydratase/carnithine racemase